MRPLFLVVLALSCGCHLGSDDWEVDSISGDTKVKNAAAFVLATMPVGKYWGTYQFTRTSLEMDDHCDAFVGTTISGDAFIELIGHAGNKVHKGIIPFSTSEPRCHTSREDRKTTLSCSQDGADPFPMRGFKKDDFGWDVHQLESYGGLMCIGLRRLP